MRLIVRYRSSLNNSPPHKESSSQVQDMSTNMGSVLSSVLHRRLTDTSNLSTLARGGIHPMYWTEAKFPFFFGSPHFHPHQLQNCCHPELSFLLNSFIQKNRTFPLISTWSKLRCPRYSVYQVSTILARRGDNVPHCIRLPMETPF